MQNKKTTISDIAAATGFCRSTVCYVLTGKNLNRIKESTQRCIREAAQKLHYSPNLLARGLRCGSSHLIGILLDASERGFKLNLLQGMETVFAAHDYYLLLCYFHNPEEIPAKLARLLAQSLDGIILHSSYLDDLPDGGASLLPPALPVIRMARPSVADVPTVNVCKDAMEDLAIRYCLANGHRRIALGSNLQKARLAGLTKKLTQLGFPPVLLPAVPVEKLLDEMLQPEDPPTLLIENDQTAAALLTAARQRGIALPERFSVLGNDGLECGEYTVPGLTTIAQPQEEQGKLAAEMLYQWLQTGKKPESRELQPFLIERGSVRPLPSR